MFCKKCGKQIPDDCEFCPSCGEKQSAATQPKPHGSPDLKPPKKKKHKLLTAVIIILLVVGFTGMMANLQENGVVPPPASATEPSHANAEAADSAATTEAEAFVFESPYPYAPGTYKVGTDLPAGEYEVVAEAGAEAYVEISSDSSGTLDSIISNDNVDTFRFITVSDGQYLKVKKGRMIEAENALVPRSNSDGIYREGMYRVGPDIDAGEYKVFPDSGNSAYVEVSSNSLGTIDSIVANENLDSDGYIQVSEGQYLKVVRGTFKKAN